MYDYTWLFQIENYFQKLFFNKLFLLYNRGLSSYYNALYIFIVLPVTRGQKNFKATDQQ